MVLRRASILGRVSILGLAVLSLAGVIALANVNQFLPQIVAQTTDIQQSTNQNQFSPARNRRGLVQVLNLTQDQVQKMQAIRRQYRDQILQTTQQVHQAKQELDTAVASTASDSEVRAKYQRLAALQQQLGSLRFESTLAVRDILTLPQRVMYVEFMQKRQQRVQKYVAQAQKQGQEIR